jgi:hypothetical protein
MDRATSILLVVEAVFTPPHINILVCCTASLRTEMFEDCIAPQVRGVSRQMKLMFQACCYCINQAIFSLQFSLINVQIHIKPSMIILYACVSLCMYMQVCACTCAYIVGAQHSSGQTRPFACMARNKNACASECVFVCLFVCAICGHTFTFKYMKFLVF